MFLASSLMTLTGCAVSSDARPHLPEPTQDLKDCRDALVPEIPGVAGSSIPKSKVAGVIGDQRASALDKDKCSHDWSDFYGDVKRRLEK